MADAKKVIELLGAFETVTEVLVRASQSSCDPQFLGVAGETNDPVDLIWFVLFDKCKKVDAGIGREWLPARDRVAEILSRHCPRNLSDQRKRELEDFCKRVDKAV